jgi:hypothetical protein
VVEKEIIENGEKETYVLVWVNKRAILDIGAIDASEYDWHYANFSTNSKALISDTEKR